MTTGVFRLLAIARALLESARCIPMLYLANLFRFKVDVINSFNFGERTALGDVLIAEMFCRAIKQKFPRLTINLHTKNPEILQGSRWIDSFNEPLKGKFMAVRFRYWFRNPRRDKHVVRNSFLKYLLPFDYRAEVHLTPAEVNAARERLGAVSRPVLAINTRSVRATKNWPRAAWQQLIQRLQGDFQLLQLGGAEELPFEGVLCFAGRLSPRESMALLACVDGFVGPDSFLMHAAAGLRVPSVIILGGRLTPENIGYPQNRNLSVAVPCGPCGKQDWCEYGVQCMDAISPETVEANVRALFAEVKPPQSP